MFSVWPKNQPKTTEIDFSRYFHFNSFPPLSHMHEPLTHALLCQAFTAPTHTPSQTEPPTPTQHDRDLVGYRNCADRRWSRSSKSARLRSRSCRSRSRRSRSHRENMLSFWVLFEFLGMNDIMCLFGSWENVRQCEQQVKNVFSMVFSRIQPKIKKYFPKIFLKCNQTHENIFFSGK